MKKILLSIIILLTLNAKSQNCSELFISEYVEGPGNNNAIEIYNPTNSPINLAGYYINRYSNGASSGPELWQLSGIIASGDVVSIGNGQLDSVWVATYWSLPVDPLFFSMLDLHCNGDYDINSTFYFNGDDAMTLENGGNILDIFGKVGEDPGSAWTDDATAGYTDANGGTWWTKRQTLVRKANIKIGVTLNPLLFNPTLEWDSLPDATYSGLGSHTCDCISTSIENTVRTSYVMYPNPASQGDNVVINSETSIAYVEIYNILGEKVIIKESNIILTKKLLKGIYFIKIYFKNGETMNNKLIVE